MLAMTFETVDSAIEKYVETRDQLRLYQKNVAQVEQQMKNELDMIAMWLREKADEIGVDSFKSKHGTAYRSLKESYRVADWDMFIDYVKETDNYQLLERRVAKNAAREIHKTDGLIPPGLDYVAEVEFNVLRPKKQSTEDKENG